LKGKDHLCTISSFGSQYFLKKKIDMDECRLNTDVPMYDLPQVTLAIFSFNQQNYINQALEGAFAQTYASLEILITDDCSSDNTVAEIEDFVSNYRGPHSVSFHRNQTNLGWDSWGLHISNAVERAGGELIVLAAGDDISTPNRVARLVEAWLSAGKPSGVLHSAFETISDTSTFKGTLREEGMFFGNQTPLELVRNDGEGILGATMAFTKDLFERFGTLPDKTVFEDRVLGFRAILAGKVLYVSQPLVRYRIHDTNVSGPNIYADAALWLRFCRGHEMLSAAFRGDYLKICPRETADPKLLCAIDQRAQHFRRTGKLVTGNPFQRAMAAWYVSSKQRNWRYRLLFILKALGLRRLGKRT